MKKTALVHSCCAHCAAYTIRHWQAQDFDVSAYWYNPNIHPFTEHRSRLEAMKVMAQGINLPLIIEDGYDVISYFRSVVGHETEGERCRYCFNLRLLRTAAAAKERGFSGFSTTLLISPHQKHELIREIGLAVAKESGIEFFYADLRKRYSESRHITKPLNLYRQQYCGCLYSEWERYRKSDPK